MKNYIYVLVVLSAGLGWATDTFALTVSTQLNCTLTDLGAVKGSGSTVYPDFEAIAVTLVAPSGVVTGFDFTANAIPGGGITGPLVQRINSINGNGTYDTPVIFSLGKNASASLSNVDSHFLFSSASDPNLQGAVGAGETYGGAPTPVDGQQSAGLPANTDDNGYLVSGATGKLTDASGLSASIQASSVTVLYLVVPNSLSAITTGSGNIATTAGVVPVSFTVAAPEPGMTKWLGLACLALFRLRRCNAQASLR